MCLADAGASELAVGGMHQTIGEAVLAAFTNVSQQKRADKREYVGVIFEDPESGQFAFTPPLTRGSKSRSGGSHPVPQGSARALYHNHPEDRTGLKRGEPDELRKYFSEGDVEVAARTGLVSYIDHGDGISVWDPKEPGEMKGDVPGLKRGQTVGVGQPFRLKERLGLNK